MDPLTLINPALSLVGTGIDMYQQDRANERNLELMKYQNYYNSPVAQMGRYREAGLNPNLIYGNGQSSAGNMSSSPEMKPYQGGSTSARNAVQSMVDGVQAGNIQADTLLKQETAETERLKQLGMIVNNEISGYNRDSIRETLDAKIAEILAETRQKTADANNRYNASEGTYINGEKLGSSAAIGEYISRQRGGDAADYSATIKRVERDIALRLGNKQADLAMSALRASIRSVGSHADLNEIEKRTLLYFDRMGASDDANAIMRYISPLLKLLISTKQ